MCNIKDNDMQQKFPKISVGSEMKLPAPIQSVLKWSFEMRLGLPVTLYCIVSNCILGQPRSHGPLLREGRVGEELGIHGNEVALRTVLVTLGHDHSSWVKM